MDRYPQVSLHQLTIDRALARQLPRGLAIYYMALPLGGDRDGVSVVMAHPEDAAALAVLRGVLGRPIVPVQGVAGEIRAAIGALWADEHAADSPARILYWGPPASPDAPLPVDRVALALSARVTRLEPADTSLDTALTVAREGAYSLLVVDAADGPDAARLARDASTPLLIVRGARLSVERVLLVLRGHAPDNSALDLIIPLAQATGAHVTLLAVAPPVLPIHTRETRMYQGLSVLLSPLSGPGEHIFACAQRLDEAGVRGTLRLRQGHPERQIADEVAEGHYDLIAIAAEERGDFVQRVLSEIEGRALHVDRPLLVVKPTIP